MAAAKETTVGRPKKYKDEELSSVTVRLPASVRSYLEGSDPVLTDAIISVATFDRAVTEGLKDVRGEVIMSAARLGLEYSQHRAETLVRLVRLGLAAEKKSPKKT